MLRFFFGNTEAGAAETIVTPAVVSAPFGAPEVVQPVIGERGGVPESGPAVWSPRAALVQAWTPAAVASVQQPVVLAGAAAVELAAVVRGSVVWLPAGLPEAAQPVVKRGVPEEAAPAAGVVVHGWAHGPPAPGFEGRTLAGGVPGVFQVLVPSPPPASVGRMEAPRGEMVAGWALAEHGRPEAVAAADVVWVNWQAWKAKGPGARTIVLPEIGARVHRGADVELLARVMVRDVKRRRVGAAAALIAGITWANVNGRTGAAISSGSFDVGESMVFDGQTGGLSHGTIWEQDRQGFNFDGVLPASALATAATNVVTVTFEAVGGRKAAVRYRLVVI